MASYNDPNACPKHGLDLEWRTCLTCDIIKLNAQGSLNFVGLSGEFGRTSSSQYTTQSSQTARPAAERRAQHERQRFEPQVISTTYSSVDDPYDFNTFDGRDDHPDQIALTPSDDKFPEDLALSDEDTAQKPHRRRNRLQKRAKNKSRTEAEDEDDMEHLALSDEDKGDREHLALYDEGPQALRCGISRSRGSNKRRGAMGRRVKFSE
ncbi:hypothetical protein SBOR_1587 [Sclerotinia borealis F-4128]|uniref:Uncharacterized protein n=1 Tax=Sclerotinia borealis (strain F-4128) TaxID=1432307 RepID=W9CQD2_SCLBF|nr:hypothetical protein SBOR_1587 [Sclerotinia borealis F-4128]